MNIERRKHHQIAVEHIICLKCTTLQHENTRQGPSTWNRSTDLILAVFNDPELHDFQNY